MHAQRWYETAPGGSAPFSVEYCRLIRQTIFHGESDELGAGLPVGAPYPGLEAAIAAGTKHLFRSGAATRFVPHAGDPLMTELALALGAGLGDPRLTPDDFVMCNGVSDGLSATFDYCAAACIDVVLPLPCYFGYELAAARAGVRIAGYYRPDGGAMRWLGPPPDRACLVVNSPDALTGETHGPGDIEHLQRMVGGQLVLTVIDAICALQGYAVPRKAQLRLSDCWRLRGRGDLVLLLGVTKDLGLAGMRAGVIVSNSAVLLEWLRALIFDRSVHASGFVSIVMLVYLRLVGALSASKAPLPDCERRSDVPSLVLAGGADLEGGFVSFYEETARRYADAATAVASVFGAAVAPWSSRPRAGYSTFIRLHGGARGIEESLSAGRHVLDFHGLRVNPSYMFGGNPALWDRLYPGEMHLRINLSVPIETLLNHLRVTLEAFGRPEA
jgi:aspartate/methionine/tyrosine aminotransferase